MSPNHPGYHSRCLRWKCPRQVMPGAVLHGEPGSRDSSSTGEDQPRLEPLNALFDVDRLAGWAASVGTVLHAVRCLGSRC